MLSATIEIPLTQGQVAIIDAEDWDLVKGYKWRAFKAQANSHTFYAGTSIREPAGRQATLQLHRLITDAPKGSDVDHRNGNGLDNRRSNLRLATRTQNNGNTARRSDNTSGFKGVFWRKDKGKYQALIQNNGERHHLGYFDTAWEAAQAYNEAALEHYGPFAAINAPDGSIIRVGAALADLSPKT